MIITHFELVLKMSQIVHSYKNKYSISSEKTRIFSHHLHDCYHSATFGKIKDRKKLNNRNKKRNKLEKLHDAGTYITNFNDKDVQEKTKKKMEMTFYYNFYVEDHDEANENVRELHDLFHSKLYKMIKIIETGFTIIDCCIGSKMMHDDYPVFLLVPGIEAIKVNSKSRADYDCLHWLLKNHRNLNIRGKEHTGHSTQYVTAGAHCSMNRKGIHIKKLHSNEATFYEPYLRKWLRRAKMLAISYLPFGLLHGAKRIQIFN